MSVFIMFIIFSCNLALVITVIRLMYKYRKLIKDYFELLDKYARDTNRYPYQAPIKR